MFLPSSFLPVSVCFFFCCSNVCNKFQDKYEKAWNPEMTIFFFCLFSDPRLSNTNIDFTAVLKYANDPSVRTDGLWRHSRFPWCNIPADVALFSPFCRPAVPRLSAAKKIIIIIILQKKTSQLFSSN